ncbi:MAG: hypothetical protein ACI841_002386 [Planctomycetota bacterium]|jgi:hypothetical protein
MRYQRSLAPSSSSPEHRREGGISSALAISIACLALAISVAGCSDKSEDASPDASSDTQQSKAAQSTEGQSAEIDPFTAAGTAQKGGLSSLNRNSAKSIELAQQQAIVDPGSADWNSELAHSHAGEQLHRIEELMLHRDQITEAEMLTIAAPDFESGSFDLEDGSNAFESADFQVARIPITQESTERHEGPAGLAALLHELIVPFSTEHEVHAHFKQYRIELEDDGLRTRALLEVSGVHSKGRVLQLTATLDFTWDYDGSKASLRGLTTDEVELVAGRPDGGTSFRDATMAVIGDTPAFQQLLRGTTELCSRYDAVLGVELFGHNGVAVADFNGDGFDDVYLAQPGGFPNLLFVREPDGTARECGAEFGVNVSDGTRAALAVDLDNDGDQDLVLGCRDVVVLENVDGQFEIKQTIPAEANYSISAADPDGDGDLDLYVCCYGLPGDPPTPYHDSNDGAPSFFLRNEGGLRFADATVEVGLDQNNTRHSFSASWSDYDADGDADLYVANDYGRNCLYRNDDGHFTNVAPEAGVEDISAGMSVSWGDYDGDGLLDIYVSNMFSSAGNRITYQRKFRDGQEDGSLNEFRRHARGNSLFRNMGDGSFADVSEESGTTMGRWSWGSSFIDIDSDGLQDLVVSNGYLTNTDSTDL